MIITDRVLSGRAAVLEAVARHPYARHTIRLGDEPTGYLLDGAAAWLVTGSRGTVPYAVGAARPAVEFVASTDAAATGRWLHLPRTGSLAELTVARHDEWEFRWTTTPPPTQPGEQRVTRLGEADVDELSALIEESFPTSTSRPGDPGVVAWYGIRDSDRLIAAGADRTRSDVGFLAGLTVTPEARGRGLGAALTAAMTRDLLRRYDTVALGVYADNAGAIRLYERLGFTNRLARSSVLLS